MKILSICTSAGLWDKVLLDAGHSVIPGCELMAHKRAIYHAWVESTHTHLCEDIENLPQLVAGVRYDGVCGGIPCQSFSKLRSTYGSKFGNLLPHAIRLLQSCRWKWFCFENVVPLPIPGSHSFRLNAMHYGRPHQSRSRWFTCSKNISAPPPIFTGSVDDLMAYPIVAGKIYGPRRASVLQGCPEFASLPFTSNQLSEALADGVPACLAKALLPEFQKATDTSQGVVRYLKTLL